MQSDFDQYGSRQTQSDFKCNLPALVPAGTRQIAFKIRLRLFAAIVKSPQ
jgi:hypothetical protein